MKYNVKEKSNIIGCKDIIITMQGHQNKDKRTLSSSMSFRSPIYMD